MGGNECGGGMGEMPQYACICLCITIYVTIKQHISIIGYSEFRVLTPVQKAFSFHTTIQRDIRVTIVDVSSDLVPKFAPPKNLIEVL